MIRAGFLASEDRADLIALARDGSAAHQLARRANALVLLDAGWSCEKVAGALLLDDDTIRKWHGLFGAEGFIGLARFEAGGCKRFAILIDEAHSSQSGKSAQAMATALTGDEDTAEAVEDRIADFQKSRGPQPHISYFAFTSTPRNVTLERFGTPGPDGKPQPFHLYSMRQAIEEGFILDVLQNYVTYKGYYQLEKKLESDPEFSGRKRQRRVARFATLHPTAIHQKAEVIVEHFRRHVAAEMGGQAKAMIVTGSREHALRMYFGVKRYIDERGYAGLKALVAFSGEVTLEGETYTEAQLNGFSEKELPERFKGDDYQLLIVAEKYQTGFNQPKLCAMYVDRKLAGL